jgi:hypothetical protein
MIIIIINPKIYNNIVVFPPSYRYNLHHRGAENSMTQRHYDPSLDRQALSRLLAELPELLRAFCDHQPAVSGRFAIIRRQCGKTPCRCERGEVHLSSVFVERSAGKRKLYKSSHELRHRLRKPAADSRELRRRRARLGKLYREILAACDRLRRWRLERGAQLLRRILPR